MTPVSHIVNTIVYQAKAERISLSPMKLQKLLYFVYKQYLKQYREALFSERFEVWMYGPAISKVYFAYKHRKDKNVREYMRDSQGRFTMIDLSESPGFEQVFYNVWNRYKRFTGIELSKFTQSPNSAWTLAVIRGQPFLSDEDIATESEYV